jgi:hypothetical protein
MLYKKINVELIVVANEAEAVVDELNATLDRLEERHAPFRWWGSRASLSSTREDRRDRHSRIR